MHSGGKFCSKDTKRSKDQTVTFEEFGVKAGGQKQKQGTAHDPCTQCHERGGQTPKLTLLPVLWTHPYYHPMEGRSSSLSGSKQAREPVVCSCSLPSAAVGASIKPCLKKEKKQE